jgi:hypothetical protein
MDCDKEEVMKAAFAAQVNRGAEALCDGQCASAATHCGTSHGT